MIGRRRGTDREPELVDVYAERLGVESRGAVPGELVAQFEHLARLVLGGEMPPAGAVSAEGAAAFGELWVLDSFLTDARNALTGKGVQ
ncbi:hypothetical protein HPO96_17450 [Kribbella sandramycini]|uniref:Uncharacterized protein n=1 Tax=Kribbella sandramycini TaxID=60450 RepID=A0A7Y4P1E7_9ACTN|nr:hypothetical protein [Kribbella sandramycini]MBB6565772.1 hypothetical protein [Kribbella sandramycini]NOL42034.1 hypothetical protein [Kribbella sandramycini]